MLWKMIQRWNGVLLGHGTLMVHIFNITLIQKKLVFYQYFYFLTLERTTEARCSAQDHIMLLHAFCMSTGSKVVLKECGGLMLVQRTLLVVVMRMELFNTGLKSKDHQETSFFVILSCFMLDL